MGILDSIRVWFARPKGGDVEVRDYPSSNMKLADLKDVRLLSPTGTQTLAYDTETRLWKNTAGIPGPTGTLGPVGPLGDSNGAITWAERIPEVQQNFSVLVVNQSGQYMIAGGTKLDESFVGKIYLSSDFGNSWSEIQPAGAVEHGWSTGACSNDGSIMIVGGTRLYLSTNYGVTWNETKPAGDVDAYWFGASMDDDGSNIIIGGEVGAEFTPGVYISTNSGTSWTLNAAAGAKNMDVAYTCSDADGSVYLASTWGPENKLYLSTNGGTAWSEITPAPAGTGGWYGLACSADGSRMIAAHYGGRLWMSSDTGTTWTEARPAGTDANLLWLSVAMDPTGQRIMAVAYETAVYVSGNYGVSWVVQSPFSDGVNKYAGTASDNMMYFLMLLHRADHSHIYVGAVGLRPANDTAIISIVLDGAGSAITTGIKADILVPYDCTITKSTLLADQLGDIAVDVWIDTYANYPPTDADSKTTPAIVATGISYQSGTLAIPVTANSTIRFNVDSCDTITRCLVALNISKT